MEPLDLTIAPPRPPRAMLAGVIFLPRTIDKVRASFDGGALGEYTIEGFSAMLLQHLGIPLDLFMVTVREALDDDAVERFVTASATPDAIASWNAMIGARLPRGGDREAALAAYPWLDPSAEIPLALDALAEDDRRLFAR